MAAALEGVRVVDLSTGVAGPMAGMLLADLGADVVRVETPRGDPSRSRPGFAMWNRSKRAVVVDLADDAGRRRLTRLIDGCDVCIAQGMEADLQAAEAGPVLATERNPALVYLAVPPYAQSVPWCGGRESNALLSAVAGVALRQSSFEGGPIYLVCPQLLYDQAIWAAAAAVAALVERERSGLGQVVTVGGVHGALVAMALTVDPTQPQQPASVGPGGPHPTYTRYRCADGRWLFLAALTQKFQLAALRALGLEDILGDARLGGDLERMLAADNRGWVRDRLAQVFASGDRDTWMAVLRAADCPAGPVLDRDDWLDHPQTAALGMRVDLEDPERGRLVMPGCPLELSLTPPRAPTPAPRLGQHDDELLDWGRRRTRDGLGLDSRSGAGPLSGFRVLDLGSILAGPFAGTLLAELGAEVIKVEPPSGDSFRERGWVYNRGQRGLAIDLRTDAGRGAFYRLARSADIVIDNYRPGVLGRLGIDYDRLTRVRPDIIAVSITAFGAAGPLAGDAGFDPLLQAMSGMMSAQGGDSEPVFLTSAVNDVSSAALAALGVGAALYHRERTGEGQRVGVALAATACLMQGEELVRLPERPPALRGGRDFKGPRALNRFYATADGWLCIEDEEGEGAASRLQRCGLAPSGHAQVGAAGMEAEVGRWLERGLARLPREVGLSRLALAGVPAAPARWVVEVAADPELQAWEVFQAFERPDGTLLQVPGRYARFSRTQRSGVMVPPGLGEHSVEVLLEAGVPRHEVDKLVADGVVLRGRPMVYRSLAAYR